MITECPSCKKTISVVKTGVTVCPKCKAVVHIGDPVKDEENKVIKTASQIKAEADTKTSNDKKESGKVSGFWEKLQDAASSEDSYGGKKQKRKHTGLFKGTPWDNWKTTGFAEAFYHTTVEIINRPSKFFKDMKYAVNPGLIPIYGIVAAFLTALFQRFWILKIFQSLFPDFQSFSKAMANLPVALGSEDRLRIVYSTMHPEPSALFAQLLLSPLMSIIITAFILHLGSVILGGRARLHHFYRMSGFIMITGVLGIVPILGNIAGFFWRAVLVFKGGRIINNFNTGRAYGLTAFYLFMSLLFSSLGMI